MKKGQKITVFSVIVGVIIVLLIIAGIMLTKNKEQSQNQEDLVSKLYNTLNEKKEYTFNMEIDEKNKVNYYKKDDAVFMKTVYEGEESNYIIKDGNTYLINNDDKVYYTYKNNDTDFTKITGALQVLQEEEHKTGKEAIEGKEYYYEEYYGVTLLSIGISENYEDENKTRFYFDGDKLAYIKIITKKEQELMKINVSYNAKNGIFEIPSGYKEL